MDLIKPTDEQRRAYAGAQPFPHAVMEGLFPEDVLAGVLAEFPKPHEIAWHKFDNAREKKLGMQIENQLGEKTRQFLYYLNSAPVIQFMEDLTGITGLIPDPWYFGGGLHQIERGGYLKVHADFNWHHRLKAHRRINLLIYLNQDWKDEYGGHLELWDKDMQACRRKILPVFGRCVVFNTTDFAFHGHPEPLACPEGFSRKSIALYYYSTSRPKAELSDTHTTLFMKRQGDEWTEDPAPRRGLVQSWAPPILLDIARRLVRK